MHLGLVEFGSSGMRSLITQTITDTGLHSITLSHSLLLNWEVQFFSLICLCLNVHIQHSSNFCGKFFCYFYFSKVVEDTKMGKGRIQEDGGLFMLAAGLSSLVNSLSRGCLCPVRMKTIIVVVFLLLLILLFLLLFSFFSR